MTKRGRKIAIKILFDLFVIAVLLAIFIVLLIYLVGRWAEEFFDSVPAAPIEIGLKKGK